jgi:hypothetical protein
MDKVNNLILKRAREIQIQFTEEGYVPSIEDCIEMATEERIYERSSLI